MTRIIEVSTENISDLKTLFETLKDVLNDTTITFYKSKEDSKKDASLAANKTTKTAQKSGDKIKHVNKSDSGSDSASDDDSDSDTDTETDSESGSETDSESGSETESDLESESSGSSNNESESGSDSDDEKSYSESDDSSVSNKKSKNKKSENKKKTSVAKNVISKKSKDDGGKNSEEVVDNFSGIKIFNVDENQTLLIFVKLRAESFIKFNCKRDEYKIGVELAPLFKQFKIMDKEGVLSMYVEDTDSLYLNMDVNNPDNQCVTNHQIKLLDLNSKAWSLPPSKFQIIVTMKCCDFHKICRDMHSVNCDLIEITCTDKKITFSCMGDSTKVNKTYDNGGGVKIKCPEKKKDNIVIVRNIYEVKYLVMFNKCSSICSDIQIYLKDDYPMFLKYQIATLGDMLVGLSPVADKTVGKTKNYNPAMDVHYPKSEIKMKGDL